MTSENSQGIYSKNAIELVTVASETCLFIENAAAFEKSVFLNRSLKLLPLLYLKISLAELTDNDTTDEELEYFVTEYDYETIRQNIAALLGYADRYLEVFSPDIQLSENGIATDISENMADIYQDLKDFLLRYQMGNEEVMQAALTHLIKSFREYWGQVLVNCLRALHNAFYNEEENADEFLEDEYNTPKNNFFAHQEDEYRHSSQNLNRK